MQTSSPEAHTPSCFHAVHTTMLEETGCLYPGTTLMWGRDIGGLSLPWAHTPLLQVT